MNWKQIVAGGLTLIATASAIFGMGYAIGKDHNEALVDFLREKNQGFESTSKVLRAEVENLKIELKSTRSSAANMSTDFQEKAQAEATATGTLSTHTKPTSATSSQITVTVSTERTAPIFDGQLLITVQGIQFEGIPLRHRVYATIGQTGKANKELKGVDTGFVVTYEGFEIRIIESDTFTATFLITRLIPTNS